ncbi:MAG: N-6 DNA methylase [Abitibacteriaceae bacterium]|nr:N-6 DNA methylase [Abditibacteriaceae bacterium]MBV9865088.1 N-6 DNA methylase [Abditibacteriaceae bacterium]
MSVHQVLPKHGVAREQLRERGQFWTPNWVAEAMVAYVSNGNAREIFDPAVGVGAFFHAAKNIESEIGRKLGLFGNEIDASVLQQSLTTGLQQADLAGVRIQDFTSFKPQNLLPAIVANPPYIRHHRLSAETKVYLRRLSREILGFSLDGRTGYHVYFLIHALNLLAEFGRLAFIIPADTFEGIFAHKLWHWITCHYRLDAVVTFDPAASPFPHVDTNAVIVLIKKAPPQNRLWWARVNKPEGEELKRWVLSNFETPKCNSIAIHDRSLAEAIRTGLSRSPQEEIHAGPILGDYAKVLRGIATGANEFFFLTRKQAADISVPDTYLLPAIGRTRDVETDIITAETMQRLDLKGRPTLLLSIDGRPETSLPITLQNYLSLGKELDLPNRALIKTRRPWYKMEVRDAPPILFAYLGRRNVRFIRNKVDAMPLTGFLCVYPHYHNEEFIEQLWQVLQHPETIKNLAKVGKSYGSGAIKVEPRALEKLPLPEPIVQRIGLLPTKLFS